jgi:hypothetical protein
MRQQGPRRPKALAVLSSQVADSLGWVGSMKDAPLPKMELGGVR